MRTGQKRKGTIEDLNSTFRDQIDFAIRYTCVRLDYEIIKNRQADNKNSSELEQPPKISITSVLNSLYMYEVAKHSEIGRQ